MSLRGLMTGAGVGSGIKEILAQREAERMMALREAAQKSADEQNRLENQRNVMLDSERRDLQRKQFESLDTAREATAVGNAARETPYETTLAPPMAGRFKAFGYPTKAGTESVEDLPIPADVAVEQSAWNKPTEPVRASKLMTPEEYAQWKQQQTDSAQISARFRAGSSEGGGTGQPKVGMTAVVDRNGVVNYPRFNADGTVTMVPATNAAGNDVAKQQSYAERKDIKNATTAIAHLNTIRSLVKTNPDASKLSGIPGSDLFSKNASIYKTAQKNAADVVTRMRTGAALNANEQEFYNSLLPSFGDIQRAQSTGDYGAIDYKLDSLEYIYRQWTGAGDEEPIEGDPNAGARMVAALRERMGNAAGITQQPQAASGYLRVVAPDGRKGKWPSSKPLPQGWREDK